VLKKVFDTLPKLQVGEITKGRRELVPDLKKGRKSDLI
jgi:hypothetical protein